LEIQKYVHAMQQNINQEDLLAAAL